MQQSRTAVIADDDKETLRDLVKILESEDFDVALALDTQHAMQLIKKHHPQLVISEIGNQNYDGISLFRYLKSESLNQEFDPKIIVLTSDNDELNEILSYDTGIDFFLKKPLRRNAFKQRLSKFFSADNANFYLKPIEEYEIRDLRFDVIKRLLFKHPSDDILQIQSKSYDILLFLARFPNQVFSREQLMQAIWGNSSKVTLRSVDIHILKIRQLLGEGYIKTIKGVGYLFCA